MEKVEKNDEKDNGVLEDKLSNVSTSFSSKEKPEEDLSTPVLPPFFKKNDSQNCSEQSIPLYQINLILSNNENRSIEILHVIFF